MKNLRRLIFILFLSKGTLVPAQVQEADTGRVSRLYTEGFSKRIKDPAYSFSCAIQGLELCKNIRSPLHKAKILNLIALLSFRNGELHKAEHFQKLALRQWRKCANSGGEAMSLNNLANIYSEMGHIRAAENLYLQALAIQSLQNNLKQTANCYINLGVLKVQEKNFAVAEYYLELALKNAEKRFDYETVAICLNDLAAVHLENGDYEKAIANCHNSLELKTICGNEPEKADTYLTLAAVYEKTGNEAALEENLKTAYRYISKYNYKQARKEYLELFTRYYLRKKDYKNACVVLQKNMQYNDSSLKAENALNRATLPHVPAELLAEESTQNRFPVLYLNILIIVAILTALNIFRLRA